MGALTIIPTNQFLAQKNISAVLEQRGFITQKTVKNGPYKIVLYKKLLGRVSETALYGDNVLLVCGTLIYRGLGIKDSAYAFLRDITLGELNLEQALGGFIAVMLIEGRIKIYTDRYSILPLYYRTDQPIISTSFLSLASFDKEGLAVNPQAILEIILGQGVIPPDTQLKGINRYVPECPPKFSGVDFLPLEIPSPQEPRPSNRKLSLHDQINRLDQYFEQIKCALAERGVLTGLTGGFDSRMLYALLRRHGIRPNVFTHWENGKSGDFRISELIALHEKLPLICVKEHHKSPESNPDMYFPSYLYTDGQCRTQYYWSEVYSTLCYLEKINPNSFVSMNGVGGEQYRNSEGIYIKVNSWPDWIKNHIFYRGKHLLLKRDMDCLIDRHLGKVRPIIFLKMKPDAITIKKYFNRVWGYANRYFRAGFECQAADHISPFCDPFVAEYAYRGAPFLGSLYDFQKDMLTMINSNLASLPSNYGFALNKKTPLPFSLGRKLLQKYPHIRIVVGKYKKINYGSHLAPSEYEQLSNLMEGIELRFSATAVNFEMHNMIVQLAYFYSQMDL